MEGRDLVWFSCGITSAVAAKMVTDIIPSAEVLYCDTLKYEHPDNVRFIRDIENWIGRKIKILKSDKYSDIYDVFEKTGYLVGPMGARCTTELKKNVRKKYQNVDDTHYFGHSSEESGRIAKFKINNPDLKTRWILQENGFTKADCFRLLAQAGIRRPVMYDLGFSNNNCIGCVKGGIWYWNHVRKHFPDHFWKMARQEREMGVSILGQMVDGVWVPLYLDELEPGRGRKPKNDYSDCGVLC